VDREEEKLKLRMEAEVFFLKKLPNFISTQS
jgi:hypothetical protein